MSANLLERATSAVRMSGGSMAVDAQGDAVAAFNTAFRRKGEGEANAELFALAHDHALLLSALTSFKVMQSGDQIAILDGDGMVARDEEDGTPLRFKVKLDAAGCPLLTPELREALRRAIGIEAANG